MEAKKKKERLIVIDYDDCCVLFSESITKLHNLRHGTALTSDQLTTWDYTGLVLTDALGNTVTGEELLETYKYYENDGLYSILPLRSTTKYGLELMKRAGYKIAILSAREERFRKQTELQIMIEGLPVDYLWLNWDKLAVLRDIAKTNKISAFIDDKTSTCRLIAENIKVSHVLLMNAPTNKSDDVSDTEIERVNDLIDALRYIGKVAK